MSDTTLRYYNTTLAYNGALPGRRIKNFRKKIRTRISRRRARQAISKVLFRI